jgi:hypothetical protein
LSKPATPQSLDVYHLDVGQGDATFIVVKGPTGTVAKTVLIDGGLKRYGQPIITYITTTLNIHRIDYVIATHYDNDHVGGLAVVLANALANPGILAVDSVFDRGEILYNHPDKGVTYKTQARLFGAKRKTLVPGDSIILFNDITGGTHTGAYSVKMYCVCVNGLVYNTPNYNAVATLSDPDENDLSTGFLVNYGKFKYLTCGDIGGKHGNQPGTCDGSYGCNFADIETNVIGLCGAVSAYKVSHHGSRCSSNLNWVSKAQAPVAVISSGRNGRYKHPREEVVQELNSAVSLVNFYMTASQNFYNRSILPPGKGFLNPNAGNPVQLTVNKINYGIDITTKSVFTVSGRRYDKN